MKKEYTNPIIEIIVLEVTDVMTGSFLLGGQRPGDTDVSVGDLF